MDDAPTIFTELNAHPSFTVACFALLLLGFVPTLFASVLELKNQGDGRTFAVLACLIGAVPIGLGVIALLYTWDVTNTLASSPWVRMTPQEDYLRHLGDTRALLRLAIGVGSGAIPFLGGALLWFVGRLPKPMHAEA